MELPEDRRLELESRVWSRSTAELFRLLPLAAQTCALDVGCGPRGALSELAEDPRISEVVGVDPDASLLGHTPRGVRRVRADVMDAPLEEAAFGLVHLRFAPVSVAAAGERLLRRCLELVAPGGCMVLQEPGDGPRYSPGSPSLEALWRTVTEAYLQRGVDLAAGRTLASRLRAAGAQDVRRRPVRLSLPAGHPYLALPVTLARELADVLPSGSEELVERATRDLAGRAGTTFQLVQVWGRRPQGHR